MWYAWCLLSRSGYREGPFRRRAGGFDGGPIAREIERERERETRERHQEASSYLQESWSLTRLIVRWRIACHIAKSSNSSAGEYPMVTILGTTVVMQKFDNSSRSSQYLGIQNKTNLNHWPRQTKSASPYTPYKKSHKNHLYLSLEQIRCVRQGILTWPHFFFSSIWFGPDAVNPINPFAPQSSLEPCCNGELLHALINQHIMLLRHCCDWHQYWSGMTPPWNRNLPRLARNQSHWTR